jgi:hypothetical protein
VNLVGLPLIFPALLVRVVPEILRGVAARSVHAFVESLKFSASKCMYGVSVADGGLEAGYEVPAPLAKVFQPTKVNPDLAKLPEL